MLESSYHMALKLLGTHFWREKSFECNYYNSKLLSSSAFLY